MSVQGARALGRQYFNHLERVALPLGAALLLFLASINVSSDVQIVVSLVLLGLMTILARFLPHTGLPRLFFFGLAIYVVIRYFHWRLFNTLSYDNFPSFVASSALFGAEVYGIIVFLLSIFVGLRPIERETAPPLNSFSELPTVDVFVPSYDEDEELLKVTLMAATAMRYPGGRFTVYLLDDGGTHGKRNQADPAKARAAWLRYRRLKKLCKLLGVHYMTRRKNEHAKAGNMNAALPHTNGDLVLILDADHVPTVDFLEKTVGFFIEDEELFLVQTPHFFINPDPVEKNLDLFKKMPSENYMFYGAIQPGLDYWGGSFFCGSAAILRRKALEESNGFSGQSITEDAETALLLHSRGWNSRYLKYPLISGLQPETFSSFMIQRMRWAQGMVQIFLLKNPLLLKGLTWRQRLCYLSNISYWFFPFARIVFAFAPAAYLVFGLHIYDATLRELLIYTLPYLIALLMASGYMYRKVRWNFISNVYETMQSMYSFGAVMAVLKNPHSPSFGVTPKSEKLEEDFISPLVKSFYWMVAITTVIFFIGLGRFYAVPEERALIAVTLFWTGYNFMLYSASLGALMERRQRRLNPRMPAGFDAMLKIESDGREMEIMVRVDDISIGGASLLLTPELYKQMEGCKVAVLTGYNPVTECFFELPLEVMSCWRKGKMQSLGIKFLRENLDQYRDIVLLAHGDSDRWVEWNENRRDDPGVFRGMYYLTVIGFKYIYRYLILLISWPIRVWLEWLAETMKALRMKQETVRQVQK